AISTSRRRSTSSRTSGKASSFHCSASASSCFRMDRGDGRIRSSRGGWPGFSAGRGSRTLSINGATSTTTTGRPGAQCCRGSSRSLRELSTGRAVPRELRIDMTPDQKADLLYELELNGFVVLRNFLPLDLIDALYEEVTPILEGAVRRLAKGEQSELRGANRICLDLLPYIKVLSGGPLEDPRFRRNPLIEELADSV